MLKKLLLTLLFAASMTSAFSQTSQKNNFFGDEPGMHKRSLEKVDMNKSDTYDETVLDSLGGKAPLHIIKYIKNGISTYYLYLNIIGSTVKVSEEGVKILFTDGTKMLKPSAKIDVEANSGGSYDYSSFINLSPSDLITLSSKTIKKFTLHIYDQEIDPQEASKFKDYVSEIK